MPTEVHCSKCQKDYEIDSQDHRKAYIFHQEITCPHCGHKGHFKFTI